MTMDFKVDMTAIFANVLSSLIVEGLKAAYQWVRPRVPWSQAQASTPEPRDDPLDLRLEKIEKIVAEIASNYSKVAALSEAFEQSSSRDVSAIKEYLRVIAEAC